MFVTGGKDCTVRIWRLEGTGPTYTRCGTLWCGMVLCPILNTEPLLVTCEPPVTCDLCDLGPYGSRRGSAPRRCHHQREVTRVRFLCKEKVATLGLDGGRAPAAWENAQPGVRFGHNQPGCSFILVAILDRLPLSELFAARSGDCGVNLIKLKVAHVSVEGVRILLKKKSLKSTGFAPLEPPPPGRSRLPGFKGNDCLCW